MNSVLRGAICGIILLLLVGSIVAMGSALRLQKGEIGSLVRENKRLSALAEKVPQVPVVPPPVDQRLPSRTEDAWTQIGTSTAEAVQEMLPFPPEDAYRVVELGPGVAVVGVEVEKPERRYRSVWRIDAGKGDVRLVSGPDDVTYGSAQDFSSWKDGFAVLTFRSPGEAVGSVLSEYFDREGKRLATTFSGDYGADGATVLLSLGSKKFTVELVQDPCISVSPSYVETGEYGPIPTTKFRALKVDGKLFSFPRPQATRCQMVYGGDFGAVNFWPPEFDGAAFRWNIRGLSASLSGSGKLTYQALPSRYDDVSAYTGTSYHPDISNLYRTDQDGEHLVMDIRTDKTVAELVGKLGDLRLSLAPEASESLWYTFFAFEDWDEKRPLGKVRFDPTQKAFFDLEME